jgi:RimJ/RimL family protein N-acetyltransferase
LTACPTIITARLVLRPFTERDLDGYLSVLQAPEVRASLHLPEDIDRDQAWTQMALWRGQWALRGTGQWAIEHRGTRALLGRAGLHRPERVGRPGIEIGWTLHPKHWGQGYATEAGEASIRYAFETFDVGEVWSAILAENSRSQSVARRLGFVHDRDEVLPHFPDLPHGLWRLTRHDWERRISAS